FLALFIAAFADDGHYQAGGLIFAAPNVVVANLLVAGGLRLRLGHRDIAVPQDHVPAADPARARRRPRLDARGPALDGGEVTSWCTRRPPLGRTR
ncbi:MAG TPA: hypothetical protein VE074_10370, partial [Jatrophihabitantaceae bacterium]|nr:hypothetical protein [Jatrophihabitantaceae bacterium]